MEVRPYRATWPPITAGAERASDGARVRGNASIISALWFVMLVAYLDRVAISFAGPAMMKSVGMSPAQFGLVLAAFGVGHIIGQLPGGVMADRWGAKTMLVLGPIVWGAFTGATALVATVAGLWIMRAGLGFAEGLFATSTQKITAENFPPATRARALSLFTTAIPLAPALSGAVVVAMVVAYGWQAMFALIAIPAWVAAFVCYKWLPSSARPLQARVVPRSDENISFGDVLKRPSLWLACLGIFAYIIVNWGYSGWMPTYLSLERHIELKSLGWISSIPYVFGFLGTLLGGWLGSGGRYPYRTHSVVASYIAAGLSLALAYLAVTLPLCIVGLSSAALFLFASQPPLASIVMDLAPDRYRGSYQAVYNTVGQIGGTLAPAVIGLLVGATGSFAAGFGFMVVALGVAAGCLIGLRPFVASRSQELAAVPAI